MIRNVHGICTERARGSKSRTHSVFSKKNMWYGMCTGFVRDLKPVHIPHIFRVFFKKNILCDTECARVLYGPNSRIYIVKFYNRMSSHPRLILLLCSNHRQIWDITSLSYVSALWKILKKVVNKTENNLTLKVKFCLYIHICRNWFGMSNCKYK
jgi:hypothetical protein